MFATLGATQFANGVASVATEMHLSNPQHLSFLFLHMHSLVHAARILTFMVATE